MRNINQLDFVNESSEKDKLVNYIFCCKKQIPKTGYYVYAIVDETNNSILYIGKGSKNRVRNHFWLNKTLISKEVQMLINKGVSISHRIIKTFEDEKEAYEYEKELIFKCIDTDLELFNSFYTKNNFRELHAVYSFAQILQTNIGRVLANYDKMINSKIDNDNAYEWFITMIQSILNKAKLVISNYKLNVSKCEIYGIPIDKIETIVIKGGVCLINSNDKQLIKLTASYK